MLSTSVDRPSTSLPIRVDSLRLARDAQQLIQLDELCIDSDGITVIMGFNGAGKSLLLRLLHGLITPDAGSITYAGQSLDAEIRQQQAMVMQRPVLLRRSVAANIDFVLKLRKLDRTLTAAILAEIGLLERANQPARSLSGGEQQRLVLARALATQPKILFLDEPTASLDPGSTALIEQTIDHTRHTGTKVVFVTHDIGQAKRLADDVVFIHDGKLSAHQPANRFFADPESQIARDYLNGRIELEIE